MAGDGTAATFAALGSYWYPETHQGERTRQRGAVGFLADKADQPHRLVELRVGRCSSDGRRRAGLFMYISATRACSNGVSKPNLIIACCQRIEQLHG